MIVSVITTLVSEIQHSYNNRLGESAFYSFNFRLVPMGVLKWIFMAFGKVWHYPCKVLDTEPGNQSALCEARMPILKYYLCLLLEG